MRLLLLIMILLSGLARGAGPARALESAAAHSARATVTLVTDTDRVAAGTPFHAALRIRLAPGWHTYWQNPGDAGVAPEWTLAAADGLAVGSIIWPAPEKVAEGPLTTFAYRTEVLLPVTVTAASGAAALRAHADWLVCEKICVPETGDFALDVPAGAPASSAEAPLFAQTAARTPVASPYPVHVAAGGTLTIADAALAASVRSAEFFPLGGTVEFGAPQTLSVRDGTLSLALKTETSFDPKAGLDGLLVLRDARGDPTYLAIAATPQAAPVASAGVQTVGVQTVGVQTVGVQTVGVQTVGVQTVGVQTVGGQTVSEMLLLALAGGLILNLMPCVFPILAMKAMAVARMSGQGRATVRAHAASYTAGVVLAFMALGAVLLVLRLAGQAAGWGFQFQSPIFVVVTAWLLFAVGLNLSGVFAIDGGVSGAGQSLAARGGHVGSFFTGLLAVVVATPCTAPFMGAAIAGAMVAPPPTMLLVFATMGLGLAAPYALLAVFPNVARALPRPGAWMDFLKELLAFPMYAAVVWLVWVMSQEAGSDGVLAAVGGLALVGFAGWALGRAQRGEGFARRLGQGAALAGVIAAGLLLPSLTGAKPADGARAEGTEPFTAVRLAALRAENRPVFVNVTAAWCVSCLVNERVALRTQAVRDGFAAHNVVYLRGDWTQQDAAISGFLHEHGRDGVPLYVLYLPGREPVVLPQVLTPGLVLAELDGAKS